MPTQEDILLLFQGQDQVSQVAQSIANNTQSSLDGVNRSASRGASDMASSYSSAFDTISRGMTTLNMGMRSLDSLNSTLMSNLGSTKSAMDWVYGTTSKEDTNKVLIKNMGDTTLAWEDLYDTVDHVTDSSLTSMQDLIPAMNAFKSATGATALQLNDDVASQMANFGAFVLAQTGSTQLALTAMMDLSKGIKNRFASLDQYGISADALEKTGLWAGAETKSGNWKGDENDIAGYMNAVTATIGSTEELMNTNEGLNAQMGKMWSRAGKRIGHEMMPGLKSLKQMFIDLDNEMNGDLSTSVLRVSLLLEETHQKVYEFNTAWDAMKNLSNIFRQVLTWLGFMNAGVEEASLMTKGNTLSVDENTAAIQNNTLAREENMLAMQGQSDMMLAQEGLTAATGGSVPVQEVAQDSMMGTLKDEAVSNTLYFGQNAVYDKISGRYGNDKIGKTIEQRKKQSEDIRKKLQETEEFEQKVFNRENLVDKWRNKKPQKNAMDKMLDRKGQTGPIADKLRSIGKEKEILKSALDSTDDTNIIKSIKDKLNKSYNPKEIKDLINKADFVDDIKKLNGSHNIPTDLLNKSIEGFEQDAIKAFDKTSDSKFTTLLRQKIDAFGGGLQNVLKTGFSGLGDVLQKAKPSNLKTSFKSIRTTLDDIKFDKAFDLTNKFTDFKKKFTIPKLGDINKKLASSFKGFNVKGIISKFKGLKDAKKVADGASDVIEGGKKVAEVAGTAGAIGGQMAGATGGLSFMGLAEMGLAGAFKTLIIPTLAIAGVIAVLIPIVAGLAIEAMFFINIVAQMMEAMNFDDIDLDGAIEGLQSIAEAFAWLGIAMGSLSFAGIMSQIGIVISSVTAILGGIPGVVDLLLKVADEIQPLSGISIDENIADNIQNLSGAFNSIGLAMLSLVGIQLSSWLAGIVTGFSLFGTIGDSIERAKNDIQKAVDAINGLNVGNIDENKVNQLKTVLDAINSFSSAFSGLVGMRTDEAISDFVSWILDGGIFGNGGRSIAEAITEAQNDIETASEALSHFNNVSDIDETTVERLKKAGESISALGDAFEGLRKIRDDKNWDAMFDDGGIFGFLKGEYDLDTALTEAKDDIVKISKSLKSLDGKLADIPDNVGERLQKVSDTLNSITTAIDALEKIKKAGGKKNKNFDKYAETIKIVKKDLIKVSSELKSLNNDEKGIADITGLSDKINNVTTSLESIGKSIEQLTNISTSTNEGQDMDTFTTMIESVKTGLSKISTTLHSMVDGEGDDDISSVEGVADKINKVTSALTSIAKAFEQLNNIDTTVGGNDKDGFVSYRRLIYNAKIGLSKISTSLADMNIELIPDETPAKIEKVTSTLYNIAQAISNLKSLKGVTGGNDKDGFIEYRRLIYNTRVGLNKISTSLSTLDIDDIPDETPAKIEKVTSTLTKINEALTEMQTIFTDFGGSQSSDNNTIKNPLLTTNVDNNEGGISNIESYGNSISDAVNLIDTVSGELKRLNGKDGEGGLSEIGDVGEKISKVKTATSKLKGFANTMTDFPQVDGQNIGFKVNRAVTGLKRASSALKKITKEDEVNNVDSIIKNINTSVKSLKTAIKGMDFTGTGKNVGKSIKNGIGSGLSNLSGTVGTKISDATRPSASKGWTMGVTIADAVKRGFESVLDLSGIVARKMQDAMTTANNGATDINNGNTTTTEGDTGGSGVFDFLNPLASLTSTNQNTDDTTSGPVLLRTTRAMINSMSNSNLSSNSMFDRNRSAALNTMSQNSKIGKNNQQVNINIGEGAIQLDARNMTTKESRQIMINALEGLNSIKGIDLNQG